jgi:iron complex outermembrane receptor protein
MKRQRLIFAFVAFFFATTPLIVFPQFKISGKTTSQDNGQPLPGANIVVQNTRFSTSSAEDGTYYLKGLKKGSYRFRVSFVGYKPLVKEVNIDKDLILDFSLEYSPVLSDEVIVKSTRVQEKTPSTFTSLENKDIERQNTGQDFPFILQITPSVVTTSDAGAGVGYTGIRIRGTDITRINVTMNGVPVNDAESQDVFFVDLPDLASSVDNIQIQRGVGTSSNGAAAFGASINIQTTRLNPEPFAEINSAAGSYNTFKNTLQFGSGLILDDRYGNKHVFKNTLQFGSGLINNKWAFDGRLSAISSDGYIDRGWSDLKSLYLSGGYYGKKTILKAIVTSGKEKTYQAWNGIPKDSLETNRRYNPSGEMYDSNGNITGYYKNQTDNYQQDYYQLHFANQFSEKLNLTSALFYTKGKGYYESYKSDEPFADYGLGDVVIGSDTLSYTNLVNRKWLDNDFYGLNLALSFTGSKIAATIGGGWNTYHGDHYGYIIWAEHSSNSFIDKPWYESTGDKTDLNCFAKVNYKLNKRLNLFGDVQVRNIRYSIDGFADDLRDLTQDHTFTFFNPKGGIYLTMNKNNNLYASVAVAHREPSRSVYRDSDPGQQISAERLLDYELGYKFQTKILNLEAAYYYMKYKDQLVLTGKINNVGDPVMVNVPESYRTGIEFSGGVQILKKLRWDLNLTLSQNKIADFVAYVDNWDTWPDQIMDTLGTTDISFSPDIVGGSSLSWQLVQSLNIVLQSKYVGRQYIDNTSSKDRSLEPYFVSDLKFYYSIKTGLIHQIDLTLSLNNILNTEYESNAWVYRYFYGNQEYEMNGYFPQAKFNVMGGVSLKF